MSDRGNYFLDKFHKKLVQHSGYSNRNTAKALSRFKKLSDVATWKSMQKYTDQKYLPKEEKSLDL
jgi:hypothetical protein